MPMAESGQAAGPARGVDPMSSCVDAIRAEASGARQNAHNGAMRPGEVLGGRFEIEQLAGSGGMGEVYRARDLALANTVAVKVLLEGRPTEHDRFVRESEVLAELSHPGIVRY